MLDFFVWYLAISIIGWLAFPIAFRLLGRLHDRGLTLARPLGLLLWGFVFWLLASFRILQNDLGGVLVALALLIGVSYWAGRGRWGALRGWLSEHVSLILAAELLFLLAFGFLALMRAADPVISGTEKPMELAFLNAILRSPAFPPNDPWLSGYSISYYYFGYVIVAMLTRLTGVTAGFAFNLGVSSWFGMTALAAFGLVYSLLAAWNRRNPGQKPVWAALGALLAPLFLLLMSNLEGVLEVLHARGITWTQTADGAWHSGFFQWLNIQEICQAPSLPFTWVPNRSGGIWWWRASRVLQDFDMSHVAQMASGQACVVGREVIDEFPFFSFLLADMHPHVLAMPFALLAVGLALNLYFTLRSQPLHGEGLFPWLGSWLDGENDALKDLALFNWMRRADFWLLAVALGGLAFLNTWDFPIYVALAAATYTLAQVEREGWTARRFWEFVEDRAGVGYHGRAAVFPLLPGLLLAGGRLFTQPELLHARHQFLDLLRSAARADPGLAGLALVQARRADRARRGIEILGGRHRRAVAGLIPVQLRGAQSTEARRNAVELERDAGRRRVEAPGSGPDVHRAAVRHERIHSSRPIQCPRQLAAAAD